MIGVLGVACQNIQQFVPIEVHLRQDTVDSLFKGVLNSTILHEIMNVEFL